MYLYSILAGGLMGSPVRSWVCQTTHSLATSGCLRRNIEGVGAGGGIVFLVGELGGLDGGLLLFAEAPVEDGELVVRGEIVGIDGLELLVLSAGVGIVVRLVVGEAEFAEAVFGQRILGEHGLQVGDRFLDLAGVALDEGAIVEGAGIAGKKRESLREMGLGVVVALPEISTMAMLV